MILPSIKSSRGYTLLFAVLIAALVLGVAVFILNTSTKQYELSVSARDSMYSFYAADSGIECASLYASSVYNTSYNSPNNPDSITCGNIDPPVTPVTFYYSPFSYQYSASEPPDPTASSTIFSLKLSSPQIGQAFSTGQSVPTCAVITIIEYYDNNGYYHDITQSRGYNHCVQSTANSWDPGTPTWGPDTTNSGTVERALQLSHSTGS